MHWPEFHPKEELFTEEKMLLPKLLSALLRKRDSVGIWMEAAQPSIQSFTDDSLQNIQCKQTLAHPWINLTRWKSRGNQDSRIFPGRILESDLSLNGNTEITSTLLGCCRAPRAGHGDVAQNNIPGSVLQTQVLVFLDVFLPEYKRNTRVAGTVQHLPQIRSVCYHFSTLKYSFCKRIILPQLFSYLYL